MYSSKDLKKEVYKLGEVAKFVGVTTGTLRRWETSLLKMVLNNEVSRIFITYEDRLTRFGFEYLKTMCEMHGTEIIVVKDIDVKKSIEQELMEDIMLLMASFSGKLYETGNRKQETRKWKR